LVSAEAHVGQAITEQSYSATDSDEGEHGSAEQQPPDRSGTPEFLAQLLSAVQHSVIAIDRGERISYWNEFATRIYAFSREEAIGRQINETTSREASDASRRILESVWKGAVWSGEFPVSHRNGSTIPARVQLFPVFNSSRAVTGIIGVSEDISAAVTAREALRQSQEHVERLARSTSDAIWDWEVSTGAFWGNAAYTSALAAHG